MTGSQVVKSQTTLALNGLKCKHMTACQIHHMDIITHACAIGSIIVIAKNAQFSALSYCHLSHIRHQVVRNAVGILTYKTALVSTYRVKVT